MADIQDALDDSESTPLRKSRNGGVPLVATLFGLHTILCKLYADVSYQGPQFQAGLTWIMRQVEKRIAKCPTP